MIRTPVTEFTGDYFFLSNFYPCRLRWNGIDNWQTVENAYQAAKLKNFEHGYLRFIGVPPGVAKKRGRVVELRDDWESVKLSIMRDLLLRKFTQNPELKEMLLETAPSHLEEGNTWKDRYWGVCPPNSGKGSNHLGKLLMDIRDNAL